MGTHMHKKTTLYGKGSYQLFGVIFMGEMDFHFLFYKHTFVWILYSEHELFL